MSGIMLNGSAIFFGGLTGILLKRFMKEGILTGLFQLLGVVTMLISFIGIISNMLEIDGNTLKCNNLIIVVMSLLIGTVLGELAKIESFMYTFGYKIEQKYGMINFSKSIISSCIFFGAGALQIIGPINSMLLNDNSTLITKSLVDFPFAISFGVSFGIGVAFSSIPVALAQVVIGLLAVYFKSFFTLELMTQLSSLGYIILFCIGLEIVFDKIIKIKTINMLPSIIVLILLNLFAI